MENVKQAKDWFYALSEKEKNRLSIKYRNTYGYGTFKDETFLEIYNKETNQPPIAV